jgi:lipopolysaccharide export system permease protein
MSLSVFETYGVKIGADDSSARTYIPSSSVGTLDLIKTPTPQYLAELAWRIGLPLAAFNFVLIGLAAAGVNPRVGRTINLGVAFLAFVVYFNLLVLGKGWVSGGQVAFASLMVGLHGGVLALTLMWLAKRHSNWTPRWTRR